MCPTPCDPIDCSPLVSSVHGISQSRILEWVAIPFSRRSSGPKDWTQVFCIAGRFFTIWATREAQGNVQVYFFFKEKLFFISSPLVMFPNPNWTQVFCFAGRVFTVWATREVSRWRWTYFKLLLLFSHQVVSDSAIPWTTTHQASLSFTITWNL